MQHGSTTAASEDGYYYPQSSLYEKYNVRENSSLSIRSLLLSRKDRTQRTDRRSHSELGHDGLLQRGTEAKRQKEASDRKELKTIGVGR